MCVDDEDVAVCAFVYQYGPCGDAGACGVPADGSGGIGGRADPEVAAAEHFETCFEDEQWGVFACCPTVVAAYAYGDVVREEVSEVDELVVQQFLG